MNTKISRNIKLDLFIYLNIILFFSSFGFRDKSNQGWYEQFFPNLNGCTITSFAFLDSLTGFAVTNVNSLFQAYILKTTNGGDNWDIKYTYNAPVSNVPFTRIQFADKNIGYACSRSQYLFKTTNCGENWTTYTNWLGPQDMAVINKDTILFVYDGYAGGVYRTTDGGNSISRIWGNTGTGMPFGIYMYNKYLGFHLYEGTSYSYPFRRTTDGGFTWMNIENEWTVPIMMADTLIGWKGWAEIEKTTNGGLNWFSQNVPNFSVNDLLSISVVNKDTVWVVGPSQYVNNSARMPILSTTDGGDTWRYQFADTLLTVWRLRYISFADRYHGWTVPKINVGEYHTKTGGNDTTYITGINSNISEISKGFILFQNYPNPFNQSTVIDYQCSIDGKVQIKILDIRGREITTLVNEIKPEGKYSIKFDAGNLPSGVYFYRLTVDEKNIDVRKMIYIR